MKSRPPSDPARARRLPGPGLALALLGAAALHALMLDLAWQASRPAVPPSARSASKGQPPAHVRVQLLSHAAPARRGDAHMATTPAAALAPALGSEAATVHAPQAAGASPDPATAATAPDYWPASALERAPMPYSAPDTALLDTVPATGLPVRLRLYVGRHGTVDQVQVLSAAPGDDELVARLGEMFRATRYLPGRHQGRDVAAYTDVLIAAALP